MTTLLDHNGQPIDMNAARSALAEQSAEPQTATVAQIWREFEAHPGRGLTPAKLRQYLLAGERGDLAVQCDLADDVEEGNPHLFAELDKRRMAVGLLDWSVEPPKNATAAEEALAAEVQEWLEMLNVEALLASASDALLKSYSAHELVWTYQEKVLLPTVTHRPGRWFTVDGTRSRLLLRNPAADPAVANAGHFVAPHLLASPTVAGEPLRPLAWWVHQHRAKSGYLSRIALVRVVAFPHLYWAYAQRDFAEFLEIYGLPLRIGKYPTGATNEEKQALLRAVTSLGHNAAGIIPMGMALEFENAAQGQRDPFMSMLQYCDAAISKAILGQTLSASEGQHGTQALGNVHNEVREDIRNADVKQVCASITNGLIKPMVMLNKPNVDPKRLPRFVLDTGDAEDMALFADNLPKLAKAGLKIGVSWTHEKLRIPQAEPGEEVLSGGDPAPVPGAPGAPGTPPAAPVPPGAKPAAPAPAPAPATARAQANAALAALAALATQAAKPDLVEQAALEAAQDWEPLLAPLVAPLLAELDAAVAQGESLADFRTRFDALVARMDAGPAADAIALRAFAARLGGEADLDLFTADPAQE